jgi:hypothetical protein
MNVGDVLFLYTEVKAKEVILPVRIHKKIVEESVSETTETYHVEIPGEERLVPLSDLGRLGKVYHTLDEAHGDLLETAQKKIVELTGRARDVQEKFYGLVATGPLELQGVDVESSDS